MRVWVGGLAAAMAVAACSAQAPIAAPPEKGETEKAGYLSGPRLVRVAAAEGGVVVHGIAGPNGRVRATAASGEAYGATADAEGRFTLDVPTPGGGPLFAKLSVQDGQRSTPAEGMLFSPPGDPDSAILLRAGAASRVLSPGASLIAAADFDADGAAMVSGRTAPGAEVRLTLDGASAGTTRADRTGQWSVRLAQLTQGSHLLRAVSDGRSQDQTLSVTTPDAGEGAAITEEDYGWRVDWATPGGGVQATLIFTDSRP